MCLWVRFRDTYVIGLRGRRCVSCPDHVAVLEASIIIMHVVTCQALCPDHVVVLIVGQKKLCRLLYKYLASLLACLYVPVFVCVHYVCVTWCMAIKIQFNVCYLVLFVCLLAKQANIQTTPGNTH